MVFGEKMKQRFIILTLLTVLTWPLYGQQNGEDTEFIVDETTSRSDADSEENTIIISADKIGKKKDQLWLPASVVDNSTIEEKSYESLADVLESTPGFYKVYDYHSPLILRGTSGTKMLILRNGNPVFSSFPGGFMGQSVNIYDLDRIEIIRGPGSVIYGSGATSGIINIIDKDVFDEKEGLGAKIGASYGTNANSIMGTTSAHYRNDNFGVRVSGRYRKADNYHYANGETAINSFTEDKDASANISYRFNDHHKITLRNSMHYGGLWGKAYGFNNKEQMLVQNKDDNLFDLSGAYEGSRIGIFDKIRLSGFYAKETREYHKMKMNSTLEEINYEDVTDFENSYYGGNALVSIEADNHNISLGSNTYIVKLWSPVKTIDYYTYDEPTVIFEKDGSQGAGTFSVGGYAQDNISAGKKISLIEGIRYDHATIFEGTTAEGDEGMNESRGAVSGSSGIVYNPNSHNTLSFNLGRAFRMPDAVDLFTEQVTCQGTIAPNADLEPEYSWNIDAGYRGNYRGFGWDLAFFINQYTDLIVKGTNPDDETEQMMKNEDNARIIGGEADSSYKIRNFLTPGMVLKPGVAAAYCIGDAFESLTEQWDPGAEGDPLTGIPPANIKPYVRLAFFSARNFTTFFQIEVDNYLKKTRLSDEESESAWSNEDVDGYSLVNITSGVSFFDLGYVDNLKLNIAVNNLLNEEYYPFGSYIYGKGRDIRIFTSMEF